MKNINSLSIIKQRYSSMSSVEKKIADCILSDPDSIVNSTIVYLAEKANVSQGSIVNFALSLGLNGFSQLKINIAQNTSSYNVQNEITKDDSPKDIMRKRIDDALSSFESTYDTIGFELGTAADMLIDADRILAVGIAHSAPVANDLSIRLMRIGLHASSQSDPLLACIESSQMTQKSVIIAVSHSGRTNDILAAVKTAKAAGAKAICLSSYAQSPLSDISDVSLIAVSKEAKSYREAVVARLTQLLLCDCLVDCLTLRMGDEAIEHLDKMVEIFEDNRRSFNDMARKPETK